MNNEYLDCINLGKIIVLYRFAKYLVGSFKYGIVNHVSR